MFRALIDTKAPVTVIVNDQPLAAPPGATVADVLLANGILACRTNPIDGSARSPYCLMGVCFECLVTIDGETERQACMTGVCEGMSVTCGPK